MGTHLSLWVRIYSSVWGAKMMRMDQVGMFWTRCHYTPISLSWDSLESVEGDTKWHPIKTWYCVRKSIGPAQSHSRDLPPGEYSVSPRHRSVCVDSQCGNHHQCQTFCGILLQRAPAADGESNQDLLLWCSCCLV